MDPEFDTTGAWQSERPAANTTCLPAASSSQYQLGTANWNVQQYPYEPFDQSELSEYPDSSTSTSRRPRSQLHCPRPSNAFQLPTRHPDQMPHTPARPTRRRSPARAHSPPTLPQPAPIAPPTTTTLPSHSLPAVPPPSSLHWSLQRPIETNILSLFMKGGHCLNGQNWYIWKTIMERALMGADLLGYCTGKVAEPLDSDTTE